MPVCLSLGFPKVVKDKSYKRYPSLHGPLQLKTHNEINKENKQKSSEDESPESGLLGWNLITGRLAALARSSGDILPLYSASIDCFDSLLNHLPEGGSEYSNCTSNRSENYANHVTM